MKNAYTITWTADDSNETQQLLKLLCPTAIAKYREIIENNILPSLDQLSEIDTAELCRPSGSRRAFYLKCDSVYEFDNPTTMIYHLSALVHRQLQKALKEISEKYNIQMDRRIATFYNDEEKSVLISLGMIN